MYGYELQVHVQVRGTYEVQVRGTGTSTGTGTRYKYEVQVYRYWFPSCYRGFQAFQRLYACTLNACTLGTRGNNTKEGTGTGRRYRYRYRYPYGLEFGFTLYSCKPKLIEYVVRHKLVKNL
jgi:hypothetical protein